MPASPHSPKPLLAAIAAGLALSAVAPAGAGATTHLSSYACTLSATPTPLQRPALLDPLGYRFDTTPNLPRFGELDTAQYATLGEGGHASVVPGRAVTDAYDGWGDLFVGATQNRATQYRDNDLFGCRSGAGGREVAFAEVERDGLAVQRTLFVSGERGSGARLVQSVRNTTATDATTSVFVGDLTRDAHRGSLGSDATTAVGPTSSGDRTLTTDDRWLVTYDGGAGLDPAIAHVWDGPGGDTSATLARVGAQAGAQALGGGTLEADRFGYGWQDVTIPAGGTATFLSWEALRAADGNAEQVGMAEDAANAISSAPAATIFEGMTAEEIRSVRNWARPEPTVAIAPIAAARADADVALSTSQVQFADASLPQCAAGTLTWDFGDGQTAVAPGGSHRFAAGTARVTVTARNACGGTATASVAFLVRPPVPVEVSGTGDGDVVQPEPVDLGVATPKPTPTPTATPLPATPEPAASAGSQPQRPDGSDAPAGALAPALTLTAPDRLARSLVAKKGIATGVSATAKGQLRIVLSGGGLKRVKTMVLQPGAPRTPTFTLAAADRAALTRAKTLQVRAKLTLDSGQEIITSRTVGLR